MQEILKQYEQVTFPGVIAGVSERRARISVLPDYAQDLTESEADLFEKCLGLSGKKNPQIDPNGFSTKMLKVCSQAITDGTLPRFKLKWGNAGTMCNGSSHEGRFRQ